MKKSIFSIAGNFLIGLVLSFIGFVNTFWGNDPFYGLAIILISLIFYLPLLNLIWAKVPKRGKIIFKTLIGLLIIWSSLGVGELFDKIDLMRKSFPLPSYESVGTE